MINLGTNRRKLIIFGLGDFAEIAYEYFTHDSIYKVVAFTVDRAYIKENSKFALPVVPFEDIQQTYAPGEHEIFAAIVYSKLNRVREEVCQRAKKQGYALASYISSNSFVWRNVKVGEHCFIFEDNTIQPFVSIGDNVVIWSGNHIGHHSKIGNNCFLSSHVVVAGRVEIGDYCFVGVNSTFANNTRLGERSWVGHGSSLTGDVPASSMVKSTASEVTALNETALFRILERASKANQR